MDQLYYSKSNASETIESVLKKLVRVNSEGELYIAVNFLNNTEIIFDEMTEHPDAHATKGILYALVGGDLYYRKPASEGGTIRSITGVADEANSLTQILTGDADFNSNVVELDFNSCPLNFDFNL